MNFVTIDLFVCLDWIDSVFWVDKRSILVDWVYATVYLYEHANYEYLCTGHARVTMAQKNSATTTQTNDHDCIYEQYVIEYACTGLARLTVTHLNPATTQLTNDHDC